MKRGTVVAAFLDDGHWSACFGLSYLELMLHDTLGPQRMVRENGTYLRKVCGTGGIPDGRNEVVRNFLDHTDGEWLWMVDTDMGFGADTVDRLVKSADQYRAPVVGGLCFALRRTHSGPFHAERFGIIPTVYGYVDADEVGFLPIEAYERDSLIRAAGTGAACLLIHRRALTKVRAKYGDSWFDPMTHPTGHKDGKPRTFSEDLSFCVRLAGCDIPLHIDTSVKTCHEKGGIFLDEDAYDRQQAFAALDRAQRAEPAA